MGCLCDSMDGREISESETMLRGRILESDTEEISFQRTHLSGKLHKLPHVFQQIYIWSSQLNTGLNIVSLPS